MKTKLKNRFLSALLAFAMVLSILPETLFLKAGAIHFDVSQSMTITAKDDFEIIFETSATGTTLIPAYFALVPDIGVAPGETISTEVASSGTVASDGFIKWLGEEGMGLTDLSVCKIIESGDITSKLSVVNKKVVITQDTFDGNGLPELSDVYSRLKTVYGTQGFYVRGNSTLITDPAVQLKDTGIPYVAVLYSQGGTPFYNIALGTYKDVVIGVSDLIPTDYVYNLEENETFNAINGDENNQRFANDSTWVGTIRNNGNGAATLLKMEAALWQANPGRTPVPISTEGKNLKLCATSGSLDSALSEGTGQIEAGKTYYLALVPDINITDTMTTVSGYVKLTYKDSARDSYIVVIPVRIHGPRKFEEGGTLAISDAWITGKAGQITRDSIEYKIIDGYKRKPVMTVINAETEGADLETITGPHQTTIQVEAVDHVYKGETKPVAEHGQWIKLFEPEELAKNETTWIAGDGTTGTASRELEIDFTDAINELGPGFYVETLKYEYYDYTDYSTSDPDFGYDPDIDNGPTIRYEHFTVYIEIKGVDAVIPTLERHGTGDASDYDANSGNETRTDPVFDYNTGSWGPIVSVALREPNTNVVIATLGASDWTATVPDGDGSGTLTLKKEALDKLGLTKFTYAWVQATFGMPPDGRENITKEARMNIKGAFPVTVNVTTDIDNTSHGEITLEPVGGGTPITVHAAGTVNKAGASYTYDDGDTKAGTTYTVCVDGEPTNKTVSVDDPTTTDVDESETTINYRTVTVHAGPGAGKVGISGVDADAAKAAATDKNDKDLTVLIDLATAQVVYLYAEPDTGYSGNAAWTSTGDAVTGSPANAVTIAKVTRTTTATASYDNYQAHVITKFADGSATTRTDVSDVKLIGPADAKVSCNGTDSSGNDWVFDLSGSTTSYGYVEVKTSSGTYRGTLGTPINMGHKSEDLILYKITAAKLTTWPGATTPPTGATHVNANATATVDSHTTAIAPSGASLTLAESPDTGYNFVNWTNEADTAITSYTVGTKDETLTANFAPIQITWESKGIKNYTYGTDIGTAEKFTGSGAYTGDSPSYALVDVSAKPKWLTMSADTSGVHLSGKPNKPDGTGKKMTFKIISANGTEAESDVTVKVSKITPTLTLTGRGEPYYAGEDVPGTAIKTVTLNNGTYYIGDPDADPVEGKWVTLALTDVTNPPTYDKTKLVAGNNNITATLPLDQVPTVTGIDAKAYALEKVWNTVQGSTTLNVTAAVSVHVAIYKDATSATDTSAAKRYDVHAGDTVTLTDKTDNSKKFTGTIPASTGTDVTIPSVPSGNYTVTVGGVAGPDLTVVAANPTEYRLDYYTLTVNSADDNKGTIVWTTAGMDATASGVYLKGTKFGVTATNGSGYHFKDWTPGEGNGTNVVSTAAYTPANGLQAPLVWTANFDPNTVTINKNLNGKADGTTSRTVALHLITSGSIASAASYTDTGTTAQVKFTAVVNGEYAIYDAKGDTGLRVTVSSNDPAAVTIQYYTVKYAATPTNGSYTGAHADDEVISNGNDARKTAILPDVKPVASYAFKDWTSEPTNCGTATTTTNATTKVTSGSWKITSSPTAAQVEGNRGILLTPNFQRSGGSIKVIVKKDNVLQGSNATTAPSVKVTYSGVLTAGGTATGYDDTDTNGAVTFTDLAPGTYTFTVNDRTQDWRDTVQITSSKDDVEKTLEYFTVTAVAGSPSAKSASVTAPVAGIVLKGKTATLTSSAADGYGGDVKWTLEKTNGDDKSTESNNDVTVSDTVVATATYKSNDIKITVYKNGDETKTAGRTIKLVNGAAEYTAVVDAAGVATFTAVPVLASSGSYAIHDSVGDTGLTAQPTAGQTVSATSLYYYDVVFEALTSSDNGSYTAGSAPATKEYLVNGSEARRTVPMPQTTPATNHKRTTWNITPTSEAGSAPGASIGETATGIWRPNSGYTGKTDIKLKPKFTKSSASLEVFVTLDGQNVPDNTDVTLTPNGGTATKEPTTEGKATFTGLSAGDYTLTVVGIGQGQQAVTITGTNDGLAYLNFFTVTTVPGTGADVAYVGTTSGFTSTATFKAFLEEGDNNSDNTAYVRALPEDGYNSSTLTWTLTKTDDPGTTAASTESGGAITVKDKVTATASYTENPITLSPGTGSVTFGQSITSLTTDPAVGKPYSGDTITFEVSTDGTTWSNDTTNGVTINGITLKPIAASNTATNGWTVSGTPVSAADANKTVTFHIRATSTATGKSDTSTVTITVNKATIPGVVVKNVVIPDPEVAQNKTATLPESDSSNAATYKGYVDSTNSNATAAVTWTGGNDPFEYGKPYTASVTVEPDENHVFAESPTGTVNDVTATAKKNGNGTVTVTYTFPAIYKLVYSPNGGSGGTQPADSKIKKGDTITIAADPGYTRSGWNGSKGWAIGPKTGVHYTFGQTGVSVDDSMLGRAENGVVTLYYVWQSSEMSSPDVNLVAIYDMDNTEWTTGTATYQGRSYTGLVAPGSITVTGDSIDWEHLSYSLVKEGSFEVTDYFEIETTGTGAAKRASLKLKNNVNILDVGTYTFKVRIKHDSITTQDKQATYTLTVRPIELDHAGLTGLISPVAGGHPATTLTQTETDGWETFYKVKSVTWAPNEDPFKNGQEYKATITLERKDGNYKFVEPDANSATTSVFKVDADVVIPQPDGTTAAGWTYTLADETVVMTRTFGLTDITVDATLNAPAWNNLTVTGFEATTEKNVNLYYLIYSEPKTFANEAALKAAYAAATAGSDNLIAKNTKANVASSGGKAVWPEAISITDNGIVGNHTYYLYVLAEAVDDNDIMARDESQATTYKKLTVAINDYGRVTWTGNSSPVDTAKKSQILSMMKDNTTGEFTANEVNSTRYGFVEWRLTPAGESATTTSLGYDEAYTYVTGERANDDTLTAIFHRKINGTFTITETANGDGTKTYSPNLSSVYIGSVKKTDLTGENVTYQWQAGNDTDGWTDIPTATSVSYTNPAGAYPGKSFQLVISYLDPDNTYLDTDKDTAPLGSSIKAKTGVQTQQLDTPEPVLSKVEHKAADPQDAFTDQNGDPVDVSKGGLHLAFPKIGQESADNNPVDYYIVELKKEGTTVKKFVIDAENKDNYYYYWEADGTDIDPTKSYTVEVKAISAGDGGTGMNDLKDQATNGWLNSEIGKDETGVNAGRRVLTLEDLAVTVADKPFNGSPQTGASAALASGKVGYGQTRPIGTITITYSNKPDNTADNADPAANKTHVNIAENVTPGGLTNDGNHSHYVFIAVTQGDLYLELTNSLYTKTDTDDNRKATDFEIYQIRPTLNISDIGCSDGEEQTLSPTVTYSPGATDIWNTGTGAAAKGNITRYFDITYSLPDSLTAGTDYTLAGNKFTPLNPGISDYPITVTASYKTDLTALNMTADEYAQFKADIAEVEKVIHVTVGAADLISITAKWDRTATYGDSDSEEYQAGDTTDFYDATDRDTAKTMKLEGLTFVLDWAGEKPDQTIVLDATASNWPGSITATDTSTGKSVTVDKGTTGLVTFQEAGTTTLTFGYSGKTATLKYTLKTCPLPYTITSDAEWIWNNSANVPNPDAAGKTTDNTPGIPANLTRDDVKVVPSGYVTTPRKAGVKNSDVEKDKPVKAVSPKLSGNQAGFYHLSTETPGKANIVPSLVIKTNVVLNQPTTKTDNGANQMSRNLPDTSDRKDEKNVGTGAWGFSSTTISWEIWNESTQDWDKITDTTASYFAPDHVYRATVEVEADTNHKMTQAQALDVVKDVKGYTINGLKDGDPCITDLDDWKTDPVKVGYNKTTVTVDETGPFHDDWKPDTEVLYHNKTTFTYLFSTFETPSLQFSDEKGSFTAPSVGSHHERASYIHHTETVTEGAGSMTYTISVNAAVKDIFGAQVLMTNKELIDAGATLELKQGNGTTAAATPVSDRVYVDSADNNNEPGWTGKSYSLMYKYGDANHEPDKDLIVYELTIPASVMNKPGTYHLELQAMGSTNLLNWRGEKVDVSKCYYTFTLVVNKKQDPPVISGGGEVELPVVTYWLSSYGFTDDMTAEKMTRKGAKPSFVPKITPMPGLRFLGWSEEDPTKLKEGKLPTLVDPLTFTIDEDKIFYAVYERVEVGHTHYVIGFPDGTFGPDNPITRGQVATIIARSCLEDFVEGGTYGNPGNYTDVEKHWANSAIAYCSMKGVFTGYEDGTFRPDRYITRQELATVVARLAGVVVNEGLPFSDSEEISSWALNGIYTNYVNGWVNGYTDGTFKPLNNITRAETVKIFNGYLGRGVDREGLSELREYVHTGTASNVQEGTDEYMTWPDVAKNHWAYYEVIEAANDHNFRWRDTTKAAPPEDWYEAFIDATWRYVDDANDGADSIGRDELPTFTVTYVVKSNGVTWDSVTEQVKKYESPDPAKLPKAEPSEGYRFAGWSDVDPDEGEINLVDPTASAVVEDKTFYAIFEAKLVITYVIGDHGDADREILTERINKGDSPTTTNLPKITAHEGWRFAGWSETDPATGVITLTDPTDHPAYADSTFYATYEREGEYTMPQVTVTYVLGDRGESDGTLVQTFDQYESPRVELLPQVTALEGWQFLGWSETDPASGDYVLTDPTAQSILADKSFYAVYQSQDPAPTEPKEPSTEQPAETEPPVEEPPATEPSETPTEPAEPQEPSEPTESPEPAEPLPPVEEPPVEYARYHYINGYTDNTFRPDDAFTRAAVATVLANLLGYDPETDYDNGAFTDLEEHWATNAINFCVAEGLMSGYTDGTFRPDDAISRQEFAVVLTRLTGETESGDLPFTDADAIAPWAAESVYTVYARGWISGYEDGTFLPERNVTRAEAVKMLNRYLDRPADREAIESQSGYTVWSDVPETHWAYYEIIEASNDWQE